MVPTGCSPSFSLVLEEIFLNLKKERALKEVYVRNIKQVVMK